MLSIHLLSWHFRPVVTFSAKSKGQSNTAPTPVVKNKFWDTLSFEARVLAQTKGRQFQCKIWVPVLRLADHGRKKEILCHVTFVSFYRGTRDQSSFSERDKPPKVTTHRPRLQQRNFRLCHHKSSCRGNVDRSSFSLHILSALLPTLQPWSQ